MFVGDEFANAAAETLKHGQHPGGGDISSAAQEHRLTEGYAREEALQVTG